MKTCKKLILSVFFTLLSISSIQIKSANDYSDFQKKYPYLELNARQVVGYIAGCIALIMNLQNRNLFKDANEYEIKMIKKTAKALGFTKKSISKLRVKKPIEYTYFDNIFRNNYAAFSNIVIIGRQDHDIFGFLTRDPNVLQFIYAHELSHIKYNHTLKTFLAFLLSPLIVHFGVTGFNKLYKQLLEEINIDRADNFTKSMAQSVLCILDSVITKFLAQTILWLLIRKNFEKSADLGAASLGPNAIQGGIKFLKIVKEVEIAHKKDILAQYDNIVTTAIIKFIFLCKGILKTLWDSHPSHEARIAYLEHALKKYR